MRKFVVLFLVIVLLGAVSYLLIGDEAEVVIVEQVPIVVQEPVMQTIGQSVEGRNIDAYTYGEGDTLLLFVGGVHGGYEWNSSLLSYELIDFLESNPETIPPSLKVAVIPSANPDGLFEVIKKEGVFTTSDIPVVELPSGTGRFNANNVDLNRNFDCKWEDESMWRGNVVSTGSEVFSEPEAVAIRDFVMKNNPTAVIFFHSQANTVYASECEEGIIPETIEIMNLYADAASYGKVEKFDAYEITGDAEGWLASIGIPAITVELENHEDTDWERNIKGVKALFEYYGK